MAGESNGWVRWGWAGAALLAFLPFLLVTVPPLADAPGHLAQLAIADAPAESPLRAFFSAGWALRLNLGAEVLVEALAPALGLERAFWLVVAAIPVLTVAAIAALSHTVGQGKAAAAGFALPFAYSYPFNFGFLNFTLGMALAFLGHALWIGMERSRWRSPLFWAIVPALLIVHAIGGGLLPLMIVARALARKRPAEAHPVLAGVALIVAWKLGAQPVDHAMLFGIGTKIGGVVLALRDQNRLLDIGSMILIVAVPIAGRLLGARYGRVNGAVVAAVAALFLALPNELDGSSYTDTRLVPAVAIAALALQDWSAVSRRARMAVAIAGFALFGIRMAATTIGFAAYARSYAAEGAALPHIAPGSRVLSLVTRQCRAGRRWRMDRLDHFPALAIVRREAWTNVMWDVPGIHLLTVRYRPSPAFFDDPSHYVWPEECVRGQTLPRTEDERRNRRRTIAETLPLLPLDRVDYLWLVHAALPPGPVARRLSPVWSNGASSLYRVIPPAPPHR